MVALTLLVFLCASLSTVVDASYSSCSKVSIVVYSDVLASRTCGGSLLRASSRKNNIPGAPDAGGRKNYSSKTGFFLYAHVLSKGQRFVSIRWARNPQYALADKNGQLRFNKVTNPQSATPPDKFLFIRHIFQKYQEFQTKTSKRYISYGQDCSVGLSLRNPTNIRKLRFKVKCKPDVHRCFCF